jgi:hypothetical protein
MNRRAASAPGGLAEALRAFIPRAAGALPAGGIALGLALLVTGGWVLLSPRLYRSEAVVGYERGALEVAPTSSEELGARLVTLATAPPRLQQLIEEMGLYPAVVARLGAAEAARRMRAHLRVTPTDASRFDVSYETKDRARAGAVLATLLTRAIDEDMRLRQRAAETDRQRLDAENQAIQHDLADKEARLAAFFATHPKLAPQRPSHFGTHDHGPDSATEVASLAQRAAVLEQQIADASRAAAPPAAPGTASPAVVAARAQASADLLAAERDLDDKQTHLPYQHPDVKVAERRVAEGRAALRKADAAVAASLAASLIPTASKTAADQKVASLRRALNAVRSRIAMLRARRDLTPQVPRPARASAALEAEGTRLARDVSEARERRSQSEAKLFQAQLLSTLGTAKQGGGFVLGETRPSHPIAGARSRVALLGAAASILLALLTIVVAGAFDERLYHPRDVARLFGGREVLAVTIPKLGPEILGRLSAEPRVSGG